MKKYLGEEFLNKIYKDLHNSEIVIHSAQKSDNKNEKVERYLDRLQTITNKAFDINNKRRENDIEYLKKLYYEKHVIKEEDVPESYFILQEKIAKERGMGYLYYTEELKQQEKETIIRQQKESLGKWIEYLASPDTQIYPTWFKYYAFQGMLKLGSYDKEKGEYNKRTKHTVKPFVEIKREALAMVYDNLYSFLQKEEMSDNELEILLESGNFGKLYSHFVRKLDSINKDEIKSDEGIWKKYNRGSNPEILYNDIYGKGTDWCTAGGIETAKTHLEGGDFYVYYTKDKEGKYTCPRIAIRKEYDEIAEIRGIAPNQNLESNMEKVVEEKLKEEDFPDRDQYKKKVKDMQMMTYIYTKYENKIELTKEDLRFIYEIDDEIIGFGYQKDPRIEEIRQATNNKKDLLKLFDGSILYCKNSLDLSGLESAEGLVLPEKMNGILNLSGLQTAKGLVLPKVMNGILKLSGLQTAKGLVLPEEMDGYLDLSGLQEAKGLVLPEVMNGNLYLNKLSIFDGIILPKIVNGSIYFNDMRLDNNGYVPRNEDGTLDIVTALTDKKAKYVK